MKSKIDTKIALLHFPPVGADGERSRAARILEDYGIDICVFGHIHSVDRSHIPDIPLTLKGVTYYPVSSDFVGFKPVRILYPQSHRAT